MRSHFKVAGALLGLLLTIPALADPPAHAPAHGWRKKHDPSYVGYTGREWPRDYGVVEGTCNRKEIGTVLGAVVGGAIGSQIGDGSGRTVAIIVGSVLGAVIGREIGRDMDRAGPGRRIGGESRDRALHRDAGSGLGQRPQVELGLVDHQPVEARIELAGDISTGIQGRKTSAVTRSQPEGDFETTVFIDLAKGLLLCDSDELPLLGEIPVEDCPPNHKGFYYTLEIEMQITTDEGNEVVNEQQWQVSVFYSPTKNPVESEDLFQMVQDFFADHM